MSPAQAPPQLFLPPVLLVCCVASPWGAHLASDSSAAMGQAHRVTSEGEARALKARATSVGGGAARQEATEHSGQERGEEATEHSGHRRGARRPQSTAARRRASPGAEVAPGPLQGRGRPERDLERGPDGEQGVGGLRGRRTQACLTRRGPGDMEEEALDDTAGRV